MANARIDRSVVSYRWLGDLGCTGKAREELDVGGKRRDGERRAGEKEMGSGTRRVVLVVVGGKETSTT